ncbi:MAG: hypothetical protein WKF92_06125 [Pyrinomonadaceae bacterium]
MKTLFFSASLFALVFTSFAAAQSVTITPKKKVYKRTNPQSVVKKTFEIIYPKVKASTAVFSKRIETAINPVNILEVNVQKEINEYQWLEEASYEVGYNKNGILSVMVFVHGVGAYPDGSSKTVVIDLKNGRRVTPADIFINLKGLAAKLKKMQRAEIDAGKLELKKDPAMEEWIVNQIFGNSNFKIKDLNSFAISDAGVTFNYDYGFQHVIKALEPDGIFLITWAELRPFIKRPGLLARFVR